MFELVTIQILRLAFRVRLAGSIEWRKKDSTLTILKIWNSGEPADISMPRLKLKAPFSIKSLVHGLLIQTILTFKHVREIKFE